jgi:hypothetical protein
MTTRPDVLEQSKGVVAAEGSNAHRRGVVLLGATASCAVTLCFFLLYWNRFAGLRSGNGSFNGGMNFLSGILPYRDYFTAGPPLNQIL